MMRRSILCTLSFVFAVALGFAVVSQGDTANAQAATPEATTQQTAKPAASIDGGRPYFIEFRSRNAANYGHAFVLYGRVGTKGTIAGLHPAGDRPDCVNCSVVAWTIGHFLPVPAETGASDGDDEPELYLTARYRIRLTTAEYKKSRRLHQKQTGRYQDLECAGQ